MTKVWKIEGLEYKFFMREFNAKVGAYEAIFEISKEWSEKS